MRSTNVEGIQGKPIGKTGKHTAEGDKMHVLLEAQTQGNFAGKGCE